MVDVFFSGGSGGFLVGEKCCVYVYFSRTAWGVTLKIKISLPVRVYAPPLGGLVDVETRFKITRGFNAMTTQNAVDACIMPILTYTALALLKIDQWPSGLDNKEIHT